MRWALACLLAVGLAGRPAEAVEPTGGYVTIQRAFLREEFDVVTSLAEQFLQQHPGAPEAARVWLWMALSLDRLQRTGEALNDLDRLKARLAPEDPLWAEVLFWEGEVSRMSFQMVRAKLAYQRLLERYAGSVWTSQAQMGLGLIYLHQQAFETALQHFHEVALQHAGTPAALDALLFEGLCRLRLSQFSDAANVFELLIPQLNEPGVTAQAAFYLGESESGLGRYEDAARAYQQSIASAEASSWAELSQFGLGWAAYKLGRCEPSVGAFERYLAHTPSGGHRTEALFTQASCFMQLGRVNDALNRFEQIVSTDPNHALALESGLILVDAYTKQEQFDLAKGLLHLLLQHHTDERSRSRVQLPLGAIALAQGNAAQARTIYRLAAESGQPAIRQAVLNGLGDVDLFLGELPTARSFYEEAIRADGDPAIGSPPQNVGGEPSQVPPRPGGVGFHTPRAAYAAYQIGRISLQLGKIEEAVTIFQRLLDHPDAALADDARMALAIAYLNQRREDAARQLLAGIRRQRPDSPVSARAAYYEALLALGANDEAAAKALCQETIDRSPDSEEAFDARILLVELQGRVRPAIELMEEFRRMYDTDQLPRRHRAKLAKRLGHLARSEQAYPDAIQWYQEAMRLLPLLGEEAAYRIGSCYEEGGDLPEALRWYQRSHQPPWRVRGQLAAAKLLERLERVAEAEAIYEELAREPIPEAKAIQERLAALRNEKE